MQDFALLVLLLTSLSCSLLPTSDVPYVKGFNITEDGDYLLEMGPDSRTLSMAQKAVNGRQNRCQGDTGRPGDCHLFYLERVKISCLATGVMGKPQSSVFVLNVLLNLADW